jgi:simple sugar transport system permease protein
MSTRLKNLLVPVLAVLFGFLLGALILVATGKSPLAMFAAMLQGVSGWNLEQHSFNSRHIGEFIAQTLPIILTGLSVGFAFRTGLFNIGAEGQLMAGSVAATAVALLVPAPPGIHVLLVLLAAMAAGGLWGAVPGWLKARFNVHEVVVAIMMNYIALFLNNWAVVELFHSADHVRTASFPASAMLKDAHLSALTHGSRLNWGFVPVLLALVLYWFVIERTSFGFSLRATGFNRSGAEYAGMSVRRNVVSSMAIAGVFAGLAGAVITVGIFSFGRALPAAEGYGFDGIAVALVGGSAALGICLSGLLFGMLKAAQLLMQTQGIPKEIASIIQGAILLFVAMKYAVDLLGRRLGRDRTQAPAPPSAPAPTQVPEAVR